MQPDAPVEWLHHRDKVRMRRHAAAPAASLPSLHSSTQLFNCTLFIVCCKILTMADIRIKNLKRPVDVAEYLFRRLRQVGVRSLHGVPGDYNLVALDYLPKCDLKWVGSVNELNAGMSLITYQCNHWMLTV